MRRQLRIAIDEGYEDADSMSLSTFYFLLSTAAAEGAAL